MNFPFGETVSLVTRVKSGTDAYGNDIWTETATDVPGAFVPGGSTEQLQGQDVVTTQPTVLLPPDTSVTAVDAVDVAGQRFEVDGMPNVWTSPLTGRQFGVEVRLKRVTG